MAGSVTEEGPDRRPVAYYKEGVGWVDEKGRYSLKERFLAILGFERNSQWAVEHDILAATGRIVRSVDAASTLLLCDSNFVRSMDWGRARYSAVRSIGENYGVRVIQVTRRWP